MNIPAIPDNLYKIFVFLAVLLLGVSYFYVQDAKKDYQLKSDAYFLFLSSTDFKDTASTNLHEKNMEVIIKNDEKEIELLGLQLNRGYSERKLAEQRNQLQLDQLDIKHLKALDPKTPDKFDEAIKNLT